MNEYLLSALWFQHLVCAVCMAVFAAYMNPSVYSLVCGLLVGFVIPSCVYICVAYICIILCMQMAKIVANIVTFRFCRDSEDLEIDDIFDILFMGTYIGAHFARMFLTLLMAVLMI